MHFKNSSDLGLYYRGTYWISSVFVYMSTVKLWQDDILTTFLYRGADKSLARSTSRCILFDGENISFMLVFLYI